MEKNDDNESFQTVTEWKIKKKVGGATRVFFFFFFFCKLGRLNISAFTGTCRLRGAVPGQVLRSGIYIRREASVGP